MTTTTAPPAVRHAEPADIDELIRLRAYLLDGKGAEDAKGTEGAKGAEDTEGTEGATNTVDAKGTAAPAAALPYTASTPEARAAWRDGYRTWLTETLAHAHRRNDVCVAVAPGPDGRLSACAIAVIDLRPPSPAYPSGRVAWMQTLVTDPRDRGKGLGTAVVDHLFVWAHTRGADVAVMQSASGAVDFHRRAGWLPTGENLYHQPVTAQRKG
ncbi:GNAT family N-acetyltransferase [Streptomyces sp. NBC_00237]|uniref:GNAT family N-acetyltransferase n=1 Tax=Streptomyces sp. NBC_00237 TaxID=2975687 RepID=UPI00224DF46A|nr:GNAT family N-acetyltransferase [Streptomyces sp. NBC_00237]MCX5207359.1 GNAT family N-acetyltransferase [Streptomyces sp. NBC_00237]